MKKSFSWMTFSEDDTFVRHIYDADKDRIVIATDDRIRKATIQVVKHVFTDITTFDDVFNLVKKGVIKIERIRLNLSCYSNYGKSTFSCMVVDNNCIGVVAVMTSFKSNSKNNDMLGVAKTKIHAIYGFKQSKRKAIREIVLLLTSTDLENDWIFKNTII